MGHSAEPFALLRGQHLVDLVMRLIHLGMHLRPDSRPERTDVVVMASDDLEDGGALSGGEIEIVCQTLDDAGAGGVGRSTRDQLMAAEKEQAVADGADDDSAQNEREGHERSPGFRAHRTSAPGRQINLRH
jgi:hypothetical protein